MKARNVGFLPHFCHGFATLRQRQGRVFLSHFCHGFVSLLSRFCPASGKPCLRMEGIRRLKDFASGLREPRRGYKHLSRQRTTVLHPSAPCELLKTGVFLVRLLVRFPSPIGSAENTKTAPALLRVHRGFSLAFACRGSKCPCGAFYVSLEDFHDSAQKSRLRGAQAL